MNHFEKELSRAKAHRHKLYVKIASVLVVTIFALGILFSLSGGTHITVQPHEAADFAEISVDGMGFFALGAAYSMAEAPAVNVSSPGYETKKVIISPDQKGSEITVTLLESPARIYITTESGDKATSWQVDGKLIHEGPSLEYDLAAGSYTLTLNNPQFIPVEVPLTLDRGQRYQQNIPMKPFVGRITIQSIPEGASVNLDGHEVGTTPFEHSIKAGSHSLQLALAGHHDVSETFDVDQNHPHIQRNYRLIGLGGLLNFNVSPLGGVLLVDGIQADPALPYKVDAGLRIKISYQAEGFGNDERYITLAAGEKLAVDIRLKAQFGKVEILSQPKSQVFINDVSQGKTPLKLELPARRQKILLKKSGYRPIARNVTPSPSQVTLVNASLIPNHEADIAEAKPQYRSYAGVELVLYQPKGDIFVMGAPRSERGQRANEFLRQTKLIRPFYAGRHEVTNDQYAMFKNNHGGDKNHPVVSIPWIDAAAFCNWLSTQENLPLFYQISRGRLTAVNLKANGYRLLTEAEWEWLARKSGRKKQTVFPWGNDAVIPPKWGNVADESAKGATSFYVPNYTDSFSKTAPVGSFKPEISGLYDITGNVSEWVHDFYGLVPPDPKAVFEDPSGPSTGHNHVVKGSSWRSGTRTPLRGAYRDGKLGIHDDVGFRIGRYLSKSQ